MPRKSILLFLSAFWCLTPKSASAAALSEDMNSAVAYAYFQIGSAADYAPDLSIDSFRAQINEIVNNGYNVSSVANVLAAQANGQALPQKTIILTFETFDQSFMKEVLPILEDKNLPFVLFLSAAKLDDAEKTEGEQPSWDDIKTLLENRNIELGIMPYKYLHGHNLSPDEMALEINRAKTRFREKLDFEPVYFSYPYGEYSSDYVSIVSRSGFVAAFSQTSGVIAASTNHMILPRFTMTEGFADIDRFRMTSSALPFPLSLSGEDRVYSDNNPPALQFSSGPGITSADLLKMDCFASGIGPLKEEIESTTVKIIFPSAFEDGKGRVNCTIPVISPDGDPEATRWRWMGFQFLFPE